MKGKKLLLPALVLLLCAMLAGAAAEDGAHYTFNSYPVDVDALKALEADQVFPVTVIKKVVTDGVDNTVWAENPDRLSLTVDNSTNDTVTGLVILAVAYNAENRSVRLASDTDGPVYYSGKAKRRLSELRFEKVNIPPRSEAIVTTPCRHSFFTGVRVMVVQYTTAEGETVTNADYEAWQEAALGYPTIILD